MEYAKTMTRYGEVKGEQRESSVVFRGIPYGGECGGGYRFQAPRRPKEWAGIRDCTRNGKYAPQFGTSISGDMVLGKYFSGGHPRRFGVQSEKQGENCLVLNVVTPGCDDKKRPVVVYIHGGGFATGSGTLVLGADRWAAEEELVVVGVNHRLNIFGFLYLGEIGERYADSGMAGMLDLVLALQWVQENIENFGGDPDKITIMGESGGGAKVSTLLAMKEAQGLFRAAIVESGSIAVGMKTRAEGTKEAREILKVLQIPEDHLELLAEKTTRELLMAMKKAGMANKALQFQPIADGIHLMLRDSYSVPEGAERIPLLVGASEDELAVFMNLRQMKGMTWQNMASYLRKAEILEPLYSIEEEKWEDLIRRFRELDTKADDPIHLFIKICSQISMLGGGVPYQVMEKIKQQAPVFAYLISYDMPHPVYKRKRYSWHTADLPLQMRIVLHEECEELSRYMAKAWAAFIRNGNPSTEEVTWPPYTRESKMVMRIDEEITPVSDPWERIKEIFSTL